MKIRHPWLIRLASWLGACIVRLLLSTLRYRVASADGRLHPVEPEDERFIYALWHEALLAPTARAGSKLSVLISLHADGEIITGICRAMGIGVIRGSTNRRGGGALLEMLQRSRETHLAITTDGPRGPRRRVQVGAIYVASRTGLPIVPIGVGFTRAWRAASWDRFAVPLPFSRILGVIGHPIRVPAELDRDGLEHFRQMVEVQLLEVTAAAEAWAENPERRPVFHAPAAAAATARRSA
jgi:lysophospholipid acyltransferase (LPLAT)-like uncharacterized protein